MSAPPTAETTPPVTDAPSRASWLSVCGWGLFLACSWTWCIGMFLPILLVRDYGLWGYIVFAAPNVLGAAAMGWVLAGEGASRRFVEANRTAVSAFSYVTLLFHIFFVGWMLNVLFGRSPSLSPMAWLLIGIGFLLLGLYVVRWRDRRTAALAVWLLSIGAGAVLLLGGAFDGAQLSARLDQGLRPGLLWLAPVTVFGFALCPYLDGTFHHARRALPAAQARTAFSIGFGGFFVVMILITLLYAPALIPAIRPGATGTPLPAVSPWLFAAPLLAHLVAQAVYTSDLHLGVLRGSDGRWPIGRILLGLIAAGAGAFIIEPIRQTVAPELATSEILYRLFMSFYGLVFPAYVWLVAIPTRDCHAGPAGDRGRRKVLVWVFAIGIAAPMFWLGFIERHELWLAPGLLVVLLSRLAVPRRPIKAAGDAAD